MRNIAVAVLGVVVLVSPLFTAALSVSEVRQQIGDLVSQIQGLQGQVASLRASIALPPSCAVALSPKEVAFGAKVRVAWNTKNASSTAWIADASGKDNLSVPTGTPGTSGTTTVYATVYGQPSLTLEVTNGYGVTNRCTGVLTVTGGPTSTSAVAVSIDPSSPQYQTVAAGSSGVTVGVYKLRASGESAKLTKLGLTGSRGVYGSRATGSGASATLGGDVMQVRLYTQTGTLLGSALFAGTAQTASTTLSTPLILQKETDTVVIAKADVAGIGSFSPAGIGDLVTVDPLNFEAIGVTSGTTLRGTAQPGVGGIRLFKSHPVFALDTLPSAGLMDGRLMRFKVAANAAGPVGIKRLSFQVAPAGVTVTNIGLYAFSDAAYSQSVAGQGAAGQFGMTVPIASTSPAIAVFDASAPLEIPAGSTYYFELRGTVSGMNSGAAVVTQLLSDSDVPSPSQGYIARPTADLPGARLQWSGNSTTTAQSHDVDWFNGYGMPGLSTSVISQTRVASIESASLAQVDPSIMAQLGNALSALVAMLQSYAF